MKCHVQSDEETDDWVETTTTRLEREVAYLRDKMLANKRDQRLHGHKPRRPDDYRKASISREDDEDELDSIASSSESDPEPTRLSVVPEVWPILSTVR